MRENWPLRLYWGGGWREGQRGRCAQGSATKKTDVGPELTSAMSSCTLRLLPQWLILELAVARKSAYKATSDLAARSVELTSTARLSVRALMSGSLN